MIIQEKTINKRYLGIKQLGEYLGISEKQKKSSKRITYPCKKIIGGRVTHKCPQEPHWGRLTISLK